MSMHTQCEWAWYWLVVRPKRLIDPDTKLNVVLGLKAVRQNGLKFVSQSYFYAIKPSIGAKLTCPIHFQFLLLCGLLCTISGVSVSVCTQCEWAWYWSCQAEEADRS